MEIFRKSCIFFYHPFCISCGEIQAHWFSFCRFQNTSNVFFISNFFNRLFVSLTLRLLTMMVLLQPRPGPPIEGLLNVSYISAFDKYLPDTSPLYSHCFFIGSSPVHFRVAILCCIPDLVSGSRVRDFPLAEHPTPLLALDRPLAFRFPADCHPVVLCRPVVCPR